MTNTEIKTGDIITFNAQRITIGNPVKGEIVSQSDEFIEIKLAHGIMGLANEWFTGDVKSFRKSLITIK